MMKVTERKPVILRSIQFDTDKHEDVFLRFLSPPWEQKFLLQLDTAARVSVIKRSRLHPAAKIETSVIITISGVEKSNKTFSSLGVTYILLQFGNCIKEIKFHVIADDTFAIEKRWPTR